MCSVKMKIKKKFAKLRKGGEILGFERSVLYFERHTNLMSKQVRRAYSMSNIEISHQFEAEGVTTRPGIMTKIFSGPGI
jgi:hypothetical protein